MDIAIILSKKYPHDKWKLDGNNYDDLQWLSESKKPTNKQLESYWIEVQKQIRREDQSLSRRKFKIGISLYEIGGETLRDKIESALQELPKPHKTIAKVSYEDGTEFDRMDDMVVMLAQEIGLSDEEVDDFFEWAMNEEWR